MLKPTFSVIRLESLVLVLWVIWASVLWVLSSGPLPQMEEGPSLPFFDKVLHWGYFGIGGFLMGFYYLRGSGSICFSRSAFFTLMLIGAFIGMLDEWHQSWVRNRSGNDLGDLVADIIGVISGLCVAQQVVKMRLLTLFWEVFFHLKR